MLRRLRRISAMTMSLAMLANAGMIASALDSSAETTVVTVSEKTQDTVETTIVSTDTVEETSAFDTEKVSDVEIGAEMRKNLAVHVMDIINFPGGGDLLDRDENVVRASPGSFIWVIGVDDANQQYRVYAPDIDRADNNCLYIKYSEVDNAYIQSHKGWVIGDLTFDGRVDVFDLCIMKRGFIYGWDDYKKQYIVADMNADGEVSIADVIWLQKWLLGIIK